MFDYDSTAGPSSGERQPLLGSPKSPQWPVEFREGKYCPKPGWLYTSEPVDRHPCLEWLSTAPGGAVCILNIDPPNIGHMSPNRKMSG
ncbi:hypothetical protein AND_006741 [Anopheles darlingi]|uniref:Uncharacterized protein n=1 Tax=Anopheles darlingi TaxID=43151 RepID=W5JC06_ANODA|nr:hypothetical protein AND_006741 [Anopheles darlingi]